MDLGIIPTHRSQINGLLSRLPLFSPPWRDQVPLYVAPWRPMYDDRTYYLAIMPDGTRLYLHPGFRSATWERVVCAPEHIPFVSYDIDDIRAKITEDVPPYSPPPVPVPTVLWRY
tara:strand:- start:362 stop:706 length:345 start_codon:yes stop_codon:yes gene_type:complete